MVVGYFEAHPFGSLYASGLLGRSSLVPIVLSLQPILARPWKAWIFYPQKLLEPMLSPPPPAIGAPTTTRPQYCGEGTGLNPVQTRNSSYSALRVSVWEAQTKIGVCNSQSLSLRTSDLKNESDPPNKRFKCILPMTYVFLLPSGPTRPDGSEMLPCFGRLCFSSGRTQCSLCRFLVLNLPSCQANSWKLSQGGPSCRPPFGFQDWHLLRSLQATVLKSNQGQNSTSWPLYPSGWVTRSQQKVPCNGYSPGSGVLGVFSWRIHIQKHPKHSQTLLEANQFPPEPSEAFPGWDVSATGLQGCHRVCAGLWQRAATAALDPRRHRVTNRWAAHRIFQLRSPVDVSTVSGTKPDACGIGLPWGVGQSDGINWWKFCLSGEAPHETLQSAKLQDYAESLQQLKQGFDNCRWIKWVPEWGTSQTPTALSNEFQGFPCPKISEFCVPLIFHSWHFQTRRRV